MNKVSKKKWFIGIDISNNTLDLGVLNESAISVFKQKQVSNDPKGFETMLDWLKSKKINLSEAIFCMEHTGTYGLLLFAWLSQRKIDFSVVPGLEIKKSLGIARGKSDKVDACRIATYAFEKKEKLMLYELPGQKIIEIKQLLTYRDQLVRYRTGLKNSLKGHLQYNQITGKASVTDDIKNQIKDFDSRVAKVEKEITNTIKAAEDLQKNYNLVSSVKGIGLVITAVMIVSTNNFQSFENGRSFACYVGTAPFGNTSGSSIKSKPKVNNIANKKIKTLLSNGANSAIKYDPELKNYYLRKTQEGKDHLLIMNAIGCKLINRAFATVRRGTPYISTYANNF